MAVFAMVMRAVRRADLRFNGHMRFMLKVRRVGNSLGILLPRHLVAAMDLRVGDRLHLFTHHDGARLSPFDPAIANALKQFDQTRRWYRTALHELARCGFLRHPR